MAAVLDEKVKDDTVAFIMAYEAGECDDEQLVEGFSNLIRTGIAWQLQGSYGRLAASLIQRGYIAKDGTVLKLPC